MATRVQQKTASVTSGTMSAITLDSTTVAGNLLVVGVATRSATVSSVTGGGTWTETIYQGGGLYAAIWSCPNCTAVSSVTVNLTGDTTYDSVVTVQEYSGVETTSPVADTSQATGSAATAGAGTTTPTTANNLTVSFIGSREAYVSGPTSSYTANTTTSTAAPLYGYSGYLVQTSATDTSTTWTLGTVGYGWFAVSATYKATASTPVWTTPADTVSMSTTPELKFTSPVSAVAQHFYLQLDTANTFDTGNLREYDSSSSQTNWTYWDGDSWEALPAGGLPSGMSGAEVCYTVTSALSSTTWYRRVRAGTLT